ncbi:TIGR04053 family radical SAM/SPASM domain-containing protein [Alicyclobacillus curvatus]|nr:TIGR04053 family radical SAM/SPASM domain-containing protein [Alicyclobacillus curvatus]
MNQAVARLQDRNLKRNFNRDIKRDFNQNPFIVIWEVTRACQLHCLHCRAEAQRHRDERELTTEEGFALIDAVAEMDHPLLVFTGGDPLERPDLYDFIRYGRSKGLQVSITPSATPKVTAQAIADAKAAGLERWAFSLDGWCAEIHDKFRGTKGSYDRTITALGILRDEGIPIQINTTVTRYNLDDLERIAQVVESYGAVLWSVFFLVPTGRARAKDMVTADEHEAVMNWLYERSKRSSFDVKTTAAPHYRRVVLQHLHDAVEPALLQSDPLRSTRGVNDGNGFVFISHIGDVYPSGFLPVKAGNVRETSLSQLYRESPVFKSLRDVNQLKGKCRVCEFRQVCGGSRARAYALTGDYLESDPSCAYVPRALAAPN